MEKEDRNVEIAETKAGWRILEARRRAAGGREERRLSAEIVETKVGWKIPEARRRAAGG